MFTRSADGRLERVLRMDGRWRMLSHRRVTYIAGRLLQIGERTLQRIRRLTAKHVRHLTGTDAASSHRPASGTARRHIVHLLLALHLLLLLLHVHLLLEHLLLLEVMLLLVQWILGWR